MGGRLHRLIGGPQKCDHSTVHVVYDMVLFLEFFFFSFCLWDAGLTLGGGGLFYSAAEGPPADAGPFPATS